jgi:hypothetical protein
MFTNSFLPIDSPNSLCLSNIRGNMSVQYLIINYHNTICEGNETAWKYNGVILSPSSSLIILAGSLLSNQTYQFMVYMENRLNTSLQATGYVLVQIEDTPSQMIIIG